MSKHEQADGGHLHIPHFECLLKQHNAVRQGRGGLIACLKTAFLTKPILEFYASLAALPAARR